MAIFFTSDTHYGHANIIKYSSRPFNDVQQMDRALVERWNSVVKPSDTVYHLGDLSFHADDQVTLKILKQLNGKIHLIYGNHDKQIRKSTELQARFESCGDYLEVNLQDNSIGKQRAILCHYPMITWHKSFGGSWMLHGHCHHNLTYPFDGKIIDVGVDGAGYEYTPLSVRQLVAMMSTKGTTALDHRQNADI